MQKYLMMAMMALIALALTACVSKRQYTNLETDLAQKLEEIEQQRDQYHAELTDLQGKQAEFTELQAKYDVLQAKHTTLQEHREESQSLLAVKRNLEQELKNQIANQSVKIETLEGQLKVTFVDKILFQSGSAQINDRGQEALRKVADSVRLDREHMIRVEGHTDNVPIRGNLQSTFPTNWELSTARATAVVRFLEHQGDIESQRLSASGYSYYQPVESNDNEAGRRQNRRIEIVLSTCT